MNTKTELSVTLSPELYEHLRAEAVRLDVPLQWLVASMVVDTVEERAHERAVA
jgi:hypothetical protein